MSYQDRLHSCRHSNLKAALQFPGQQNWATPAAVTVIAEETSSDMKFYMYTGAFALSSLMTYLFAAGVTA